MNRNRSTIPFPYGNLNEALAIARAVAKVGGQDSPTRDVAAHLSDRIENPKFRSRLAAAQIFGLVENRGGRLVLTGLGRRIVEPESEARARVDAFLRVKLYRAIYESCKDQDLPPKDELEARMRELGVPPKQAKKARQVFDRSAEQAGFFQDGRTRLIAPILARPLSPPAGQVQPPLPPPTGRGNALWILDGISIGLPEPGTNWPMSDRVKWLQAAAQIFAVAYQGEDAVIDMTIRATKPPGSADEGRR